MNSQDAHPKHMHKFLFVSFEGLIGDLAYEVKKKGHHVKYYIKEKTEKDVCDGFVEKCDDWKREVAWADVVIFDDLGFGKEAEELRKEGKRVIGGSTYTDRLEDDRDFGQEELKAAGVNIIPSWKFTDFDTAIAFIKEHPDRYVIKPSGQVQNEKQLLFVGLEEDGKDILDMLERYKKNWAKKIKEFQIQKFVSGVEVAVGAFFDGDDFVGPINVNFEHKKLFPGDLGFSTGEMGCYDDQTEVLTKRGWKFFQYLQNDDELLTYNPASSELEYQRPTAIVSFAHHKKLIRIKNRSTDLLVTPDHNMFGIESNKFRKKSDGLFSFTKAASLPVGFVSPRTGTWKGHEIECMTIPAVDLISGKGVWTTPSKIISMDDWLAFFGIWIAEGSSSRTGYLVSVTQVNPKKIERIESIIRKMPFKFKKTRDSWICYSKQLWSMLAPFGTALTKYLPENIKNLSSRQLSILFDAMMLGDGGIYNKTKIYYTSSKRLADDVQEILVKMGKVGMIKRRLRTSKGIGNRLFKTINPSYEVSIREQKTHAWLDARDKNLVDYSGKVYCAEVPNHTMYVRRNGLPLFCGNTHLFFTTRSPIFDGTLAKMKEKLAASGYVGYIDINCIVNGRGMYPLEFTARFGYPHISIALEGILSDVGTFLYELASKHKPELRTKRGLIVGVVVAVPPFPFRDPDAFKMYSEDATIIFKKPITDGYHLGDVKLVEDDWRLAGQSGYVLVITGSGSTMEEARTIAYNRLKNIIIPNMFYRIDIGARWHNDSDRLQTWGYL